MTALLADIAHTQRVWEHVAKRPCAEPLLRERIYWAVRLYGADAVSQAIHDAAIPGKPLRWKAVRARLP